MGEVSRGPAGAAALVLVASITAASAAGVPTDSSAEAVLRSLGPPPAVQPATEPTLFGWAGQPLEKRRAVLIDMVSRVAKQHGLPPAVADAVVRIESAYSPTAVGDVGEIGLMQVRPSTAAMLGFRGPASELASPEVNVQYGVRYLAKAWRLADGDLCRALMKYRAGHGETRMTVLSAEYCRRARAHLAFVGAPEAMGYGTIELGGSDASLTQATAHVSPSGLGAASLPMPMRNPKVVMGEQNKSLSTRQLAARGTRGITNLYFAQARSQSARAHARVSAMRNASELLASHRAGRLRSS